MANSSTWISQDQEILSRKYFVRSYTVTGLKSLFASLYGVVVNDLVFCWFASFRFLPHILLARILGKPIVIAVGGYEVAHLDVINYGALSGRVFFIYRMLRRWLIRQASLLLAVSESNYQQIIFEIGAFMKAKIKIIPLAVSAPSVQIPNFEDRKKQIILLASIENRVSYEVKGIDVFVELAWITPDYKFCLIGKYDRQLFPAELPTNLTFVGWVENMSETFVKYGLESQFVIQPSRHESFGMSLVEMACFGAFPIGSSAFALPETISALGGKNVESNEAVDYKREIEKLEIKGSEVSALSLRARETFSTGSRQIKMWDALAELDTNNKLV